MESIIKKAIEGGWKPNAKLNGILKGKEEMGNPIDLISFLYWELVILDPLFWQALGKACGWASICSQCGKAEKPHEYRHIYRPSRLEEVCVDKALCFHEINLTEGWEKAVDYLLEIIK